MNTELNDINTANEEARKQIADARAQLDADSRDLHQQMVDALEKNAHAQNDPEPAKTLQDQAPPPETNPQTTREKPAIPRSPYEPAYGPLGYLNTLPAETQAYIRALLEEYSSPQVAAILAKPAPEGIEREISTHALFRFHRRQRQTNERKQLAIFAQKARESLDNADATDAEFTNAAVRFIRASLLDTVTEVNSLELLKSIHGMINSLRRTDIAERRINLAEQKEKK